jgi:16S rRNA G966 N2-methylase RsmD
MANISDLKFDHKNARKRTDSSARLIQESLQRYGAARSIVIDEDNRILAGNGTIEGAKALGLTKLKVVEAAGDEIIAVRRSGLSEDDKVGLALADNRAAELSDWDAEMLQQLSEEHDIAPWFDQEDLDALLQEAEQLEPVEGNTDPDEVPEAPEDPITKPGDLWILGNHRLLCGDSTNIQDVERLMDGQKADMVFTDPPYGVNYEGGLQDTGDGLKSAQRQKLMNDDIDLYYDAVVIANQFSSGPVFMFHADTVPFGLYKGVETVGGEIVALLIWRKPGGYGALGASYKPNHEPCLLWKPKGAKLNYVGPTTETRIWEIDKEKQNKLHPTQKPVAVPERAIANHKAQVVLDLFGGSGSTLIACERQHRHARLMELDPAYCDVIVKRWEDFTGNTAICQPSETHFTTESQEAF